MNVIMIVVFKDVMVIVIIFIKGKKCKNIVILCCVFIGVRLVILKMSKRIDKEGYVMY